MWKIRQNLRGAEKGQHSGRHDRRSRDAEQRGCRNRAARTSHENLGVSRMWRGAGSAVSTTHRTLVQRNSSLTSVLRRQFSTTFRELAAAATGRTAACEGGDFDAAGETTLLYTLWVSGEMAII